MGYAENGDWFSNFSGEQIDGRLYNAQGRNWVRNGYFAGGGTAGKFPINQRGSLSYSNAGGTIDGWELLQNQSLTINNEDIQIVAALDGGLSQTITNGQYLRGETVTFSFVKNSAPASASVFADGNLLCELLDNTNSLSLKSAKFVIPSFATAISVRLNYGRFNAVCLEQGAVSTLATEVNGVLETMPYAPDYGEELAKCQRYLCKINTNIGVTGLALGGGADTVYMYCNVPVPMAGTPKILGGVSGTALTHTADIAVSFAADLPAVNNSGVQLAFSTTADTSALSKWVPATLLLGDFFVSAE